MRNKFINRVQAERLILSTVNKNKEIKVQLNGLSKAAIFDWSARNKISNESELFQIIIKASEMTHSLADVSNEVFNEEEEDISKKINLINDDLSNLILSFME